MDLKSAFVTHPVFAPEGDIDGLREEVSPLYRIPPDRVSALIDEIGEISFVPCPACDGNTHEGRKGTFDWTLDRPDEIRCTTCRTVYPNAAYPCDEAFEIVDPTGKPQVYRYHRTRDGKVAFLEGMVRMLRYANLRHQALALAQVYGLTHDMDAAHRAAVLLHRFAEVYPHWPVSGIDVEVHGRGETPEGGHNFFFDSAPPYPNRSGKWTWWHYMEIPTELVTAYDLVYDSGALEAISQDAKARIERDMLRPSVAFVDAFWPGDTSNMGSSEIRGRIVAGRVLGEPAWVHRAVDHTARIVDSGYFADGVWREGTPDYHGQITRGLRHAVGLLEGHSDPPGYVDALTGDRYDVFEPASHFPILEVASTAHRAMTYPNGHTATVHDAWGRSHPREPEGDERPSGSRLLPATGHAVLSVGEGESALEAHLHFCLTDGHAHRDLLNLSLFAKGRELLSDFGYTHTFRRPWATCTLGHNTVLVDGKDQAIRRRETWGNLRLCETTDPGLQVVEASSETVYPDLGRYRRTIAVVPIDEANAYVLDLFRVAGGSLHEWAIHGAADADQVLDPGVPMRPGADSLASLLADRGQPGSGTYERYAEVYDVSVGEGDAPLSASFAYADGSGPRLRTTYLGPFPVEVVTGMVPSIHRANQDNAQVDAIRTPIFIARRSGPDLQSAFLAVHEPTHGDPRLSQIEPLPVGNGLEVGARVVYGDRTDLFLSTPEPDGQASHGDIGLTGRLGRIRMRSGDLERLDLIDGRSLSCGGISIQLCDRFTGEISNAGRDGSPWLETPTALPEGDLHHGRILLLSFANGRTQGCRIDRVEPLAAGCRVYLLDDPAIAVESGGVRMLAFPHWTFDIAPCFEIASSASLARRDAATYVLRATGSVALSLEAPGAAPAHVYVGGGRQPVEVKSNSADVGFLRVQIPASRLSPDGTEIRVE